MAVVLHPVVQNFDPRQNFRMADISNLKISDFLEVERPNVQVTTIDIRIHLYQRQNCEWCGISNRRTILKFAHFYNFDSFTNSKNFENLLIVQLAKFWKFVHFSNCEILEIFQSFKLRNSGNLLFFEIAQFWKLVNFWSCKILEIC